MAVSSSDLVEAHNAKPFFGLLVKSSWPLQSPRCIHWSLWWHKDFRCFPYWTRACRSV